MSDSPGRNAPCPCGSGEKFKRCCLGKETKPSTVRFPTKRELKEMRRDLDRKNSDQLTILKERFGILVNYVSPIMFKGKRVWAIGGRVFPGRRPEETFHEFLMNFLKTTLGGEPWRKEQMILPPEKRHFLMKCFEEELAFRKAMAIPENLQPDGHYSAISNGYSSYILSLAWDVASLSHAASLPEFLLRRLRDPVAYQGARYEIGVAAVFARLDFEIRFLDDEEALRMEKRVEFEATHRPTGEKCAVEAKSRHRAGIINHPGPGNEEDPLKGDGRAVRSLYLSAVEKAPTDLPYFIFIDVNAPLEPEAEGLDKQYMKDIIRWLGRFPAPTAERPDPFNALIITNFAPHYQGSALATGGESNYIIPLFPKNPVNPAFMPMLDKALKHYLEVPEFREDGRILD